MRGSWRNVSTGPREAILQCRNRYRVKGRLLLDLVDLVELLRLGNMLAVEDGREGQAQGEGEMEGSYGLHGCSIISIWKSICDVISSFLC